MVSYREGLQVHRSVSDNNLLRLPMATSLIASLDYLEVVGHIAVITNGGGSLTLIGALLLDLVRCCVLFLVILVIALGP